MSNDSNAPTKRGHHPLVWIGIGCGAGCLVLVVLAVVLIGGVMTVSRQSGPSYQTSAPTQWTKIATIQGRSDKQTDSFTVGGEWKIAWDTKAERSPYTMLGIQIWRPDGAFVDAVAGNMGTEKDESVQHTAGTFYLKITASQPYSITIWDNAAAH